SWSVRSSSTRRAAATATSCASPSVSLPFRRRLELVVEVGAALALDSPDQSQADFLGDPFRRRIPRLDEACESLQAQTAEGEVATSASCLGGVALVPAVAPKVVAELRNLLA